MASWRDEASEETQRDLDNLFNQAALLAQTLLMRNREFFPFGAAVNTRGSVALSTPLPAGERPSAHDVITSVASEFARQKRTLRAAAIVAMASVEGGGEAVRVDLEHSTGVSLTIALPYRRDPETGVVTYGQMSARPGEPRVWARAAKKASGSSTATKGRASGAAAPKGGAAKSKPAAKAKPAAKSSAAKSSAAKPRAAKPATGKAKGSAKGKGTAGGAKGGRAKNRESSPRDQAARAKAARSAISPTRRLRPA